MGCHPIPRSAPARAAQPWRVSRAGAWPRSAPHAQTGRRAPGSRSRAGRAAAAPSRPTSRSRGRRRDRSPRGTLAIAAEDLAQPLAQHARGQKRDLPGRLPDRPQARSPRRRKPPKVGEGAGVQARKLAYFRDKLLLDEYLEREVKKAGDAEAARRLYDEAVKAMKPRAGGPRAPHPGRDRGRGQEDRRRRVKGGEDFAKFARRGLEGSRLEADGGDLGFFTKDRMVPEFAEAAFKLEPGQISEPVKSAVRLARHQGRGEAHQAGRRTSRR